MSTRRGATGVARSVGFCPVPGRRSNLRSPSQVLDQQHRAFVVAVVAIAHDHGPAAIVQARDLVAALRVGIVQHRGCEDMADVLVGLACVLRLGVGQHQGSGIGFAEVAGVGGVQHEVALAAGAQRAHQQGLPLAAVQHVAGHGRAVDEVAVMVVVAGLGEPGQTGHHATGHIGQFLRAVQCGETVQHAVVAAHVDHGGAALVGRSEGLVFRRGVEAGGVARVPDGGIDDVALARLALAEGAAGGVTGRRGRALHGAHAAQVAEAVGAQAVAAAAGCAVQVRLLDGADGRPAERNALAGIVAPAQDGAVVEGRVVEVVQAVCGAFALPARDGVVVVMSLLLASLVWAVYRPTALRVMVVAAGSGGAAVGLGFGVDLLDDLAKAVASHRAAGWLAPISSFGHVLVWAQASNWSEAAPYRLKPMVKVALFAKWPGCSGIPVPVQLTLCPQLHAGECLLGGALRNSAEGAGVASQAGGLQWFCPLLKAQYGFWPSIRVVAEHQQVAFLAVPSNSLVCPGSDCPCRVPRNSILPSVIRMDSCADSPGREGLSARQHLPKGPVEFSARAHVSVGVLTQGVVGGSWRTVVTC
ncbi:hypothetical protein FQR65_LT20626 [Abscondita terminalis]|nr:hypothetical protein FQR65_LT20626 [Abscondita terminalis]